MSVANINVKWLIGEAAGGVALFSLVWFLQAHGEAYSSEFGSHSDEAAHVVTGLMVYDYMVGGDWLEPMAFAETYYVHYPKVAIGHWPPFFYVVQSLWMTIWGANRTTLLLLMASLCTAVAMTINKLAQASSRGSIAVSAALIFVLLPSVQRFTSAMMTEMLMALLSLAAAIAFANFMKRNQEFRWALVFAFAASLAILTKGTGLSLALLPGFSLLFARQVRLFARPGLWLSAVIVIALCSPFYFLTLEMQRNGMQHESFSLPFLRDSFGFYSVEMMRIGTIGVGIPTLLGLFDRVIIPWRRRAVEPLDAAMAGLIASIFVFHVLVPCGLESRHLIPALPPLMIFLAAGLHRILAGIESVSERAGAYLGVGLPVLLVVAVGLTVGTYQKQWNGYAPVAAFLNRDEEGVVSMISSDPQGEGMLIAEVAIRDDQRPSRYVLRASKMLASDRWAGRDYQKRFDSPEDIKDYLEKTPIKYLIVDRSLTRREEPAHHQQLIQMIDQYPDEFLLLGRHDLVRGGIKTAGAIHLYQMRRQVDSRYSQIEVDMEMMRGRSLQAK